MKNKLTFKQFLLEKKKKNKKRKYKKKSPLFFPYGVGFYHTFASEGDGTGMGDGAGVS
jgi:hypothetical protein